MTDDPLSAMAANAVMVHEVFTAYISAGFTPEQALHLVTAMVAAATRNSP